MWNILAPLLGPTVEKVLDLIPDKNARAEAREKFELAAQQAVTQASELQAKINMVEAGHRSVFVSGWRPFIGWVCGVGLAWSFLAMPFLVWATDSSLPAMDTDGLYQLVLAMLGMGALRTYEKTKGVARVS